MVGFNRRFAPPSLTSRAPGSASSRRGSVIRYTVNAGPLDAEQLVQQRRARGLPLRRRGRPFHRHRSAGGSTRGPSRSTRSDAADRERPARRPQLRRRLAGQHRLPALTATRGCPKEMFEVAAGGRTARFDNFRQSHRLDRPPALRPAGLRHGRQGPGRAARPLRRRRPVRRARCRSRSRRWPRPPRRPWPSGAAWRSGGPSAVTPVDGGDQLSTRLVRPAPQRHVPGGDRLASAGPVPSGGCGPGAASDRRPRRSGRRPGSSGCSRRPAWLASTACRRPPKERVLAAADEIARRAHWEILGVERDDLAIPTGRVDPISGRSLPHGPLRVPDRLPRRRRPDGT